MSIPLQASLPLALHLKGDGKESDIARLVHNPGASSLGYTVDEFNFLRENARQAESTALFAAIIRAIHVHPDWAQLHAFFSKRYSKREMFSDRELRRLAPPKEFVSYKEKKVTAHFRTDPSLVGVAKDIKDQFATAGRTIRSGIIGSDPHPAVVGPAIGLALGVGAFMDLVYRDAYRGNASSKAHTSEEWAKLWDAVADWVYEYEAASLEQGFIGGFSYKRGVTDADRRSIRPGDKIPKGYLATDAIDAADAVHSAFKQLAAQPMEFYGMEWDFLELEMSPGVKQQFYARFGTKPADNLTTRQCLFKEILNQGPDVRPAVPAALHVCPVTLSGADWEEWFLAVKGGQVIMPATVFQALWAVMFVSQLPLNLEILPQNSKVPTFRDTDTIYM